MVRSSELFQRGRSQVRANSLSRFPHPDRPSHYRRRSAEARDPEERTLVAFVEARRGKVGTKRSSRAWRPRLKRPLPWFGAKRDDGRIPWKPARIGALSQRIRERAIPYHKAQRAAMAEIEAIPFEARTCARDSNQRPHFGEKSGSSHPVHVPASPRAGFLLHSPAPRSP